MAHAGIGTDLEGIHAVRAAIVARRVIELTVERGRLGRDDISEIVRMAEDQGVAVSIVDDVRDRATTAAPQGVVAKARPLQTLNLKEAVERFDNPALLVVDHVEDPRNIGAAARSALACGMSGIVVSTTRSAPLGATAFKAAVGTFETLPVVTVSSVPDALKRLGQLGLWRVGLDGAGDQSILGMEILAQPVALCVGAEGKGLSRLAAERCDVVAKIPMAGPTESLNASVASAIGCFEVARVRGWVS